MGDEVGPSGASSEPQAGSVKDGAVASAQAAAPAQPANAPPAQAPKVSVSVGNHPVGIPLEQVQAWPWTASDNDHKHPLIMLYGSAEASR